MGPEGSAVDRETAARNGEEAYRLLAAGRYEQALAIYLELAQNGYGPVSAQLGYIYDHMRPRDVERAKHHYAAAVEQGDVYAMYALGGLTAAEGNLAGAVFYYDRAIRAGDTQCYYPLYLALKKLGATREANAALDSAAAHGNPFAIRNQSLRRLSGKEGLANVFYGAAQYIRNLPALMRAQREIYPERSRRG